MRKALGLILLIAASSVHAAKVYQVTVTRTSDDLYEVDGRGTYIKTRYCYEYVYSDDAILRIDAPGGYTIGRIIFSNGKTCEVEKVLRG